MLSILRTSRSTFLRSYTYLPRFYSTESAPPTSTPKKAAVVSSCPAGTIIQGLNIRKGQEPIVALKDEEYPEWLWKVLTPKSQEELAKEDPIKAAKKARRQANRQKIKENNFIASMSK